jgi:hypothetical protein
MHVMRVEIAMCLRVAEAAPGKRLFRRWWNPNEAALFVILDATGLVVLGVREFDQSVEYSYRLVKAMSQAK